MVELSTGYMYSLHYVATTIYIEYMSFAIKAAGSLLSVLFLVGKK
jgi:hypothetical protein